MNNADIDCKNLKEKFGFSFSLPFSPIWMDNSTTTECDEMNSSINILLFKYA